MPKKASSSNEEFESETTASPEAGPSSADGFQQPLGEPEVCEEESGAASVEGTATIGVKLMSIGCAIRFHNPLTDRESEELHRDLTAVLEKYDAPNIPFAEEFTLIANVGGIVFRRVANEQMQAAARIVTESANATEAPPQPPPQQEPPGNDLSSAGQEGFRQNSNRSQAGGPRVGGEAGDLLS